MKRPSISLAGAAALFVLAGCATTTPPPTAELAVGRAAIADAVGAGASQYAPVDLQRAQSELDRADAEVAAGHHQQARRLAESAEADARLAAATARSQKAERALAEVKTGIDALRREDSRTAPR